MAVRISVGGENFETLRKNGSYYVDKTELLYELVQQKDNAVTLFTRPRRFGKTLMMRMMESFFDIRRDSKALFDGLAITKHADFCREWMNQYPVLMVSFKDVAGLNFDGAYGMLEDLIASTCADHAYLEKSEKVSEKDSQSFARLVRQSGNTSDIKNSLLTLTRMLCAHYGKPVILLIDEYDVPLAKANEPKEGGERYYPQMLDVMRGMLSTALKGNDALKFGVVTGCLRIAKESIFTGLNNFASFSVLDDEFSRYFGFTEAEIDLLLEKAELTDKKELLKQWYDGYSFGMSELYSPWDAVNYVSALLSNRNAKPKNYWKNTSGNGILRDFVERKEFRVKGKFETLMNGGTITQTISDSLTYDTLHDTEDNLWSVLLMTGYLTKADPNAQGETVALRIPNQEVLSIFQDTVVRFFTDHVDRNEQNAMMNALWAGDEAAASEAISDLLWRTISYMDYHENYYHAFLTGVFVGLGYEVESNPERGLGRPDILLKDDDHRRALLIEAKRSAAEAQMEQDCDAALAQIEEKQYADALYGYRTILRYGVAFYRKSAMVKKRK